MELSDCLKTELELIKTKIDKDEVCVLEQFLSGCTTAEDVSVLAIRYRHFLREKYSSNWGSCNYEPIKRPIKIAYLLNPDKIFYNEIDDVICNYLRNEGAEVIPFTYQNFYFKGSKNGIDLYIDNKVIDLDGFLSYGYRSKNNMDIYMYVVQMMEQKGVVCLHSHEIDCIINSKLLQSIYFGKAKIPIPDTYQTFDIQSTKTLVESVDIAPCIVKLHDGYGGAGVSKIDHKNGIINFVGKCIWKNEHILVQKYVPDSIGRSVRVLCFNGKTFSIAEYQDLSGSLLSNASYGDKFRLNSLMSHPKYNIYAEVAEKALSSLGDILIGGVDILDSKTEGVVVLEVNGFPDIFDNWLITGKCGFHQLAKCFMDKIKNAILKRCSNKKF
ncbi:probable alpha-L-glutamate ligase [Hydra vulgaris]|uniref:probable alpha-L-glutamate ligase n=1 Tax=Hydra vulgaris TaxID=6087 RepID=UPI0001926357|nr:probable alpha-L-glutamate ligase [Hydra vulgaris]XP_002164671.3 probable alpha-L-glutamate ligase [Hydra vulgaris]XP_047124424.1 probable alpha-L-glutamate ligase [Hydra vulgaris]